MVWLYNFPLLLPSIAKEYEYVSIGPKNIILQIFYVFFRKCKPFPLLNSDKKEIFHSLLPDNHDLLIFSKPLMQKFLMIRLRWLNFTS